MLTQTRVKPRETAALDGVNHRPNHGVAFTLTPPEDEEHGGTKVSSQKLGADEHVVIKTLVFDDETKAPLLALMHGDGKVSARALVRLLGVKSVQPCKPEVAQRYASLRH